MMLIQRLRGLKSQAEIQTYTGAEESEVGIQEETEIPDMTDRITSDLSTRPESGRKLI